MQDLIISDQTAGSGAPSHPDDRIGVLYFTTAPFLGGICYGVRSIIRQLDKRRFRPLLALPEQSSHEIIAFFREAGIEIATVRTRPLSHWSPLVVLDYVRSIRDLARLIRENHIHILHSSAPRGALLGPMVRLLTGAKFVWQIAMLGQPWYSHFWVRFADRVPCVSRAVYQEYGARRNMQVIWNGPWTEMLSPEEIVERRRALRAELGIAADVLVVGSVANFQYWKGIHVLIEAFARVAAQLPNVLLVHLGGPVPGHEQYLREIDALIEKLGIGDRIRRLGFRPDAYRYYPLFDVFVHVPVPENGCHEAFGHSVAEAMAYALPVLASRCGGPGEIVDEGVTGELIEPGNTLELAEKILTLLRDPERRRRMGEAGYARYHRHFTIAREVGEYQRLYAELIPEQERSEEHKYEREARIRAGFSRYWESLLADGQFAQAMRLAEVEQLPFFAILCRSIRNLRTNHVRVLEVGAGSATVSRVLAKRLHGSFYALDILPQAMQVASRAMRNGGKSPVHCLVADLRQAPFPSASFDLVFSQGLVEHFADPSQIIRPQVELLKPGGYLVINVPQKYNLYTLYKHFRMRRGRWGPGWETQYSAGQLADLGRQMGLELWDMDGHGSFLRWVAIHFLRPVLPAAALRHVCRLFESWDRVLRRTLRSLFCMNVVGCFRKPGHSLSETSREEALCRS